MTTLLSGVAQAAAPEVLGVRAGRQPDATRLVIDLSQKIDYRVFTLANPYRVVIDLPNVQWKISREGLSRLLKENASIKAFRYGQFGANGARIVMEMSDPVGIKRNFLLNPIGPHPFRFVLDMEPIDDATFAKQSAPGQQQASVEPAVARVPAAPAKKDKDARRVVVIDPGHGGIDPGAIGVDGYYEKAITLAVAKEMARQFNATGRYKAVLTRDDDRFMALRDRVAFARAANADLFISIHADSHADSETRGASIYSLSDEASDREAAAFASKENKADVIGGVDLGRQDHDVQSILIDLAQRETMNRSKVFANLLVQEFDQSKIGLLLRPHRSAGFAVLTAPDVPAVLIEVGYLSNATDERLLRSQPHQQRLARAIIKATNEFFAGLQPPMTASASGRK